MFCVDEIVIFDDGDGPATTTSREESRVGITESWKQQQQHDKTTYTGYTDPIYFLTHILSYLECPPHLRRRLFDIHQDLRFAGSLPSLDMPHHLRKYEWCQYREGVTEAPKTNRKSSVSSTTTPVHTGLTRDVYVMGEITANSRITVKFKDKEVLSPEIRESSDPLVAETVKSSAPREEAGYYWGYSVRSAPSLSAVLTECPFDGGYDVTFGTSERGESLTDLISQAFRPMPRERAIPNFAHMMIVLGGVAGLEPAVRADATLRKMKVSRPEELFDYWVNVLPGQGSRTIRTEEALWLALMGLRGVVQEKGIK